MKSTRSGLALLAIIAITGCALSGAPLNANWHPATDDLEIVDSKFPPEMRELSFTSGASKLNGLMYIADGPGPHPTVILLHGYAGNERNLDLAQAMRRDGKNVLYFNYRGTWGSGGEFSISNALQDVARALELVKDERWVLKYRSDASRVALVGHSFGGFLGAMTTAADPDVSCFAFLAGANLGVLGSAAKDNDGVRTQLEEVFGSDMDPTGGPIRGKASDMVGEMVDGVSKYDLTSHAETLATRPLLLVAGTRDTAIPKANHHDQILAALRKAGTEGVTELVLNDDHSFSANRVELAKRLVDWQREACWQ